MTMRILLCCTLLLATLPLAGCLDDTPTGPEPAECVVKGDRCETVVEP